MKCAQCGYELSAFDVVCQKCGAARNSQAARAPFSGAPPISTPPAAPYILPSAPTNPNDQPDSFFAAIGFCLPLIGVIMYFVTKGNTPQKASSALKGAAWGFGATFVIAFLTVVGLTILGSSISNNFDANTAQISPTPSISQNAFSSERESLEQSLPAQISAELLKTRNINVPCTKLQLIEISKGNYTGVAFFQDNSTANLKVTSDASGYRWEFTN